MSACEVVTLTLNPAIDETITVLQLQDGHYTEHGIFRRGSEATSVVLPEFLPVIGPLDDAIVAAVVLRHLVRKAGSDVVYEHWRGDPATITRVLRVFRSLPADDPRA